MSACADAGAATEAQAYGWGGVRAVSCATGLSPNTIRKGLAELSGREVDAEAALGSRLRRVGGDRAGQDSIRINDQWRICFEWPDGAPGPSNVEIVDYH